MNYTTLIQFAWRVLFLSLIASPVLAQVPGERYLTPPMMEYANDVLDATEIVLPKQTVQSLPAPVQNLQNGSPEPGFAPGSKYWIVSSRCAVQTIHQRQCGPWALDVFERQCGSSLNRSSLDQLAAEIDPNLPICIFSHGSFVRWETQCREAHAAFQRLQRCTNGPIQFIFFTWPSDGPYTYILPADVGVRGNRAEFNGFHMAHLISRLPCNTRISLIGHSHGSRVVLSAMHLAGGGLVDGHVFNGSLANRRYRVILAAAATDHDWLNPGQRYGCALNATECLLNLRNRCDYALAFYPLVRPLLTPSLGRRGFSRRDQMKLGWNSNKVRCVDVTANLGHDHLWPDYYNDSGVVSAILPYICF